MQEHLLIVLEKRDPENNIKAKRLIVLRMWILSMCVSKAKQIFHAKEEDLSIFSTFLSLPNFFFK